MHAVILHCVALFLAQTLGEKLPNESEAQEKAPVGKHPSLRVRLTPRGANYTDTIKNRLLDRAVAKLYKVPDFNEKIPGFTVGSEKAKVTKYEPASDVKSTLDGGYTRIAKGGSITVEGTWTYRDEGEPVEHEGTYRITLENTETRITGKLVASGAGTLILEMVDCSMDEMSLLQTSIENTLTEIDLTRKVRIVQFLMREHKRRLEAAYCPMVGELLEKGTKKIFGFFPKSMNWPGVDEMMVTYYLTGTKYSEGSFDILAETKLHYKNKTVEAAIPPYPMSKLAPKWNESMMVIQLSDYILNSQFMVAQDLGLMSKVLKKGDLGSKGELLATTCKKICLGKFSKELAEKYPGRYIEVSVGASEPVTFTSTPEGLTFSGKGQIRVGLDGAEKPEEWNLIMGNLLMSGTVENLKLKDKMLGGKIKVSNFDFKDASSTLSDLQGRKLLKLAKIIGNQGKGILEKFMKKRFGLGIPLPTTKNMKFVGEPKIWYHENGMSIGVDFKLSA